MRSQIILSSNSRSLGLLPRSRTDGEFVAEPIEVRLKKEAGKSVQISGCRVDTSMAHLKLAELSEASFIE